MQLLIASRNKHKVQEIRAILEDLKLDIISSTDIPSLPEIVEDAPTIRENAIKKATQTALMAKRLTMADDTGLEVDALNGEPGVFSARFAGPKATYHENNRKLLQKLEGVPMEKRTARFRAVIAMADEGGLIDVVEGICNGVIIEEERGGNGFGYDPLFIADGQVKTFAETPSELKNRLSHRAKALAKAWAVLSKYIREHSAA